MKRIRLAVDVNLDPVVGEFHTTESATKGIQAILSQRIPHYDPHVLQVDGIVPKRDESLNTGEFDDEFPDEHSHEPQDISLPGGDQGSGVFATDEEGRHYYLEIKVTSEGLILDVFDRHGEECFATVARTFDELVDFVFANDPLA